PGDDHGRGSAGLLEGQQRQACAPAAGPCPPQAGDHAASSGPACARRAVRSRSHDRVRPDSLQRRRGSMIFLDYPQGSPEWLQARAGVITASRFADARSRLTKTCKSGKPGDPSTAAIRYAWTVAMERVAGKPVDSSFETWQMRRGVDLEPAARVAYEARTGFMVQESGLVLTDDSVFGYSTDGFVEDDGMVEIKCPASCDKLGAIWGHPEEAESEYIDQINGGLWITGRKWCDLIVYCPWLEPVGKELFIKRIERDDDAIDELAEEMWQFHLLASSHEQVFRQKVA